MFKFIATTTIALSLATTAFADSQRRYATITKIKPRYSTVQNVQPIRECYTVEVPVYGNTSSNNGASAGDVLGGMIIGGILGKGVSGNDQGAAAGAVLGGMIAADNKQGSKQGIIGYRQEQRCENRQKVTESRQIRDYKIWFQWDGIVSSTYTYNNYKVGDSIPVAVSIVAQ